TNSANSNGLRMALSELRGVSWDPGLRAEAVDGLVDDADGRRRDAVVVERTDLDPRRAVRVGRARETAAERPADEIDQHVVEARAPFIVEPQAIEDVEHRANFDVQAGLLAHLSHRRGLERLAELDGAAG